LKVRVFFLPNVCLLMACYFLFLWVILIDEFLFLVCRNYLDIVHLISNFDGRRKWNYQNEMNIEEYVGKVECGNVKRKNSKIEKNVE
jgi:hypothetical protein